MPIFNTSKSELLNHIAALGVRAGDRLCVHSRMLSFGRIEGGVEFIQSALLDAIGPTGTIAVPTFTFNLTADDVYDASTTSPFMVGSLSDFVRQHPDALRTQCPVHSFSMIGPAAKALMAADPCHPIGRGSAFEVMSKEGFKLLLLGCTYQEGATHVHHVEATVGVPYRSWITFSRQVRQSDGTIRLLTVHYYAKIRNAPKKNNLTAIERMIDDLGLGQFVPVVCSGRRSHCIALGVLERAVRVMIQQDPYALVERCKDD